MIYKEKNHLSKAGTKHKSKICRTRDYEYGVSWQQYEDSDFSYMISDDDEKFEALTSSRKTRQTKAKKVRRRMSGERFGNRSR